MIARALERSRSAWACSLALAACLSAAANAALITQGAPTTSVSAALIDPSSTLIAGSTLPSGRFLVPIEVTGAEDLQDWSFDLVFDAGIAAPVMDAGFFGGVFPAFFSDADPTPSSITSSGFVVTPGVLSGIAGFSGGVSGDGLLAFVLFESASAEPLVEPGTLMLMCGALGLISAHGLIRVGRPARRPRALRRHTRIRFDRRAKPAGE